MNISITYIYFFRCHTFCTLPINLILQLSNIDKPWRLPSLLL